MADETTTPQPETPPETPEAPAFDLGAVGGDEPRGPSIADMLRERGQEIADDATDDDVFSRMEELEVAWEERERLRQQNEQLQQQAQQLQAWYQKQQPPETPPEEPKSTVPPKPEWNEAWEAYLEPGPNGTVVVAEAHRGAVDPSLPQKYLAYKKWERDRLSTLLDKSDTLFDESKLDSRFESIRKEAEEAAYKRAIEEFEKRQQQTENTRTVQQFEQQNPWLFTGQKDVQGNQVLTQDGEVFNELYMSQRQYGVPHAAAEEFAKAAFQTKTGRKPWDGEEGTPSPTSKKSRLRQRKNNGQNRIAQPPVKRAKAVDEILERPSARELEASWASIMKQEAGIED